MHSPANSSHGRLPQLDALVITAPGINCDLELCRAFELAGAHVETLHVQRLVREPALIDRFRLIGLPGGFSFGDDIAAGRVLAQLIRQSLYPALVAAMQRGVPMITPCNGFQIAVQSGLLPGPAAGPTNRPRRRWRSHRIRPRVSVMSGRAS